MAVVCRCLPDDRGFEGFLERERAKDLLRFTTAGSVDDGKSTLIGRLLYDSRSVYDDQLESVTKASVGRNAGAIDFSLLTDGLRAEREQGITIDVAYRYFATPRRKFIIADTPGHEQYTRNMVTGASTAELAIVLVDARKGVLPQSRRHAYIASLLGLTASGGCGEQDGPGRLQRGRVRADRRRFPRIPEPLTHRSVLHPDERARRRQRGEAPAAQCPGFGDRVCWRCWRPCRSETREEQAPFAFRCSAWCGPNHEFRGYAGRIAAGIVRPGEPVTVFPCRQIDHVSAL